MLTQGGWGVQNQGKLADVILEHYLNEIFSEINEENYQIFDSKIFDPIFLG